MRLYQFQLLSVANVSLLAFALLLSCFPLGIFFLELRKQNENYSSASTDDKRYLIVPLNRIGDVPFIIGFRTDFGLWRRLSFCW